MIAKSLDLYNFRNYHKIHLDLHPKKNIIIGNNGTGKTNILESIVMIADTRSFRADDDQDLILKTEDTARIDLKVDDDLYRMIITNSGKTLFINNTTIKRSSDFIGKVNAVLFKPDDLEIFTRGPKYRRRILDLEIGKMSKKYLEALLTYSRLLKDKNALLKEDVINDIYLKALEERMILPIKILIEEREELIKYIDQNISRYYESLTDQKEDIRIIYKRSCEADEEKIKDMIDNDHRRDLFYHYTVSGPHKEDITFMFHGSDVTNYASQGQKRLVMLSFKLAIVEYIIKKTNERPILLLDDILSELDIENKERLLKILPKDIQTIITATDIQNIKLDSEYRLFRLEKRRNTSDQREE